MAENSEEPKKEGWFKDLIKKPWLLWVLVALGFVLIFNYQNNIGAKPQNIVSYSQFVDMVKTGGVTKVELDGNEVKGVMSDGKEFKTIVPATPMSDVGLIPLLRENNIEIMAVSTVVPWYASLLSWILPIGFLIFVWVFFLRKMMPGAGGPGANPFGKSKAHLREETDAKVTFGDVAGADEAKAEVAEIVEFLKNPTKFTRLGGRMPRGVLLTGAPGTGKTLLARSIAGEADVPFFTISGSDFVEMFVGVGAARVRDLFGQAEKKAPCIIFIDELDAVGRHRGAGMGGGNDEREQTLNQLLVGMDGFDPRLGIIIIAATNRPDVLDPALLRPGRFDRQVVLLLPDLKGREEILKIHIRGKPLSEDVDLGMIARGTPGVSGADLENLTNEAALFAAREDAEKITAAHFEAAKDKISMGSERKMIMSDKAKTNTAYHEAGHTLVAKMLPNADPVHKVTIIPRGRALGLTCQLPTEDRYCYAKDDLLTVIMVMMGGRAAEDLVFGQFTTGASNDLERANELARKMVCNWGMSEDMGPATFGRSEEHPFLGKQLTQKDESCSEATKKAIDDAIRKILDETYEKSIKILADNRIALNALAEALLEKETLDGEEIAAIVGDASYTPPPVEPAQKVVSSSASESPKRNWDWADKAGDLFGAFVGVVTLVVAAGRRLWSWLPRHKKNI